MNASAGFQTERIVRLIEAIQQHKNGNYRVTVPGGPVDDVHHLGRSLQELALMLERRFRELQQCDDIAVAVNTGVLLDEVLDRIYSSFCGVIPYDRIGCSLIDPDGQTLRARWLKAEYPDPKIFGGFTAPLKGSSLETIIATGRPRILNNLVEYLANKPNSFSTRLIVAEGVRSSLTCPLVANGVPVGFLFFSSRQTETYATAHVELYQRLAQQVSLIIEKGRLITQLTEQKVEIERQNQELQRLNMMKNKFLGMVAHDLRNPVANVQSVAEVLLDSGQSLSVEEQRGFLQDILDQAHYMLPLLNDLLDVAQIESSKLSLRPEQLNLKAFLTETVSRHNLMAERKGTKISLEMEKSGYCTADLVRLRQVVDNLISNAVKYSPPRSAVRVRALKWENGWRIEVQDSGPGLTEEDKKRLFQDFARLSAKPTGQEKSTGLGLAITRRIVEAHKGQIGADSVAGQGATFWLTLPE